jgi:hypothetical protein
VFDIGAASPREPVRIEGVLVRLAQWSPEHPRLLGFPPRHVGVREGADEALNGLHAVIALSLVRPGTRNEPSALGRGGLLRVEAGRHAVALEQRDQPCSFTGARPQVGHHPAPILRVHDGRVRRDGFTRVTAGLPQDRRAPHHPRHQVDLGGFRDRLVDRAR